jgi:rubredoxin
METLETKKVQKSSIKYVCKLCDYITCRKSQYNRHLETEKHKNNSISTIFNTEVQKSSLIQHKCINCDKIYKERTGLWKHNKKCNKKHVDDIIEENFIDNNKINEINENTVIPPHKEDIKALTDLVLELVKSNKELQNQMLDVCKNSNTTINSNSNNKTFNMQVFLNEKCKDAMNIMDFVNSMDLKLSDLEELGELGYVEGISRQMIRKLSEMDVYKRPIHCSDLKRETIYVRDNGVWEKENITYDKLRKAIKYVTAKNGYLLEPWRDANPQCMNTQHPLNDVYVRIMSQAMGGKGEFFDSENKIIKKVSKVITIDKSDY